MRFLKHKILRAMKVKESRSPKPVDSCESLLAEYLNSRFIKKKNSKAPQFKQRRKRIPGISSTTGQARRTKNIVKNYGKAICGFSGSSLALPYLEKIASNKKFDIDDFMKYANSKKTTVDSIDSFKQLFMESEDDTNKEMNYKEILKRLGQIFIKFFSVNWIYGGKMTYKEAHLKFRFKILRRILNPELFTYLKPHRIKQNDN